MIESGSDRMLTEAASMLTGLGYAWGPNGWAKQGKARRASSAMTVSAEALVDDGLSPQLAAEWLAHRKAKRAPLTQRAWDGIKREATIAKWTISQAVIKSIERNWTAFEAAWVYDERVFTSAKRGPTAAEMRVMQACPGIAAPHLRQQVQQPFTIDAGDQDEFKRLG